jgi:hypothetical protein
MNHKPKRKNKEVELPEIARRVLSFVFERENEFNLFPSYEVIERHCGENAGEGLDYLLKKKLIDFHERYHTYFVTPAGELLVA